MTNAGLAPGYFPQWTDLVWRPTRAAFRALHPRAKAATRTVLLLQRKSTRSTAGRREMPEGTTADPQELINALVGIVAMDAFVTGSVATSMRAHGRGILDQRKHEGAVRRQMEKLRLCGCGIRSSPNGRRFRPFRPAVSDTSALRTRSHTGCILAPLG